MSTPKSPTAMVGLDGKLVVGAGLARLKLVNQAPSGNERSDQLAISPVAGSILESAKGVATYISFFLK